MDLAHLLPAPAIPLATVGVAIVLLAAATRRRRRSRRLREKIVTARLHSRKRASARRALAQIRALDPIANPARMFAYLRKVDPLVFEEMILSELEDRGQRIRRGQRYSGDGGSDGIFWIDDRLWLIQAKRYGRAIRPEHVQAFGEVCADQSARGLFVHTGRTGPLSRTAAEACPHVRVLSGDDLVALFAGHRIALAPAAPRSKRRTPETA